MRRCALKSSSNSRFHERGRRELRLFGLSFSGGFLHAYPILPSLLYFILNSLSLPSKGIMLAAAAESPLQQLTIPSLYRDMQGASKQDSFCDLSASNFISWYYRLINLTPRCLDHPVYHSQLQIAPLGKCTRRMHDVVVSLLACKVLILRSLWMWGKGLGLGRYRDHVCLAADCKYDQHTSSDFKTEGTSDFGDIFAPFSHDARGN